MNQSYQIENMQKEDLPQISVLYEELIPEGISLQQLEKQFEKIKQKQDYYLLVAKENKKVLGTAIGIVCQALDVPFLVIENVVVDATCRNQGVGKKIFQELDNIATESNCQYAILVSSGFRKVAHKFYQSMGYEDDVRGFRKYYY